MPTQTCQCPCGHTRFEILGRPLFRILCHCTICQRFNAAPMADVVIYDAVAVQLPAAGSVSFQAYKPPPNVQRGKCTRCGAPAIEVFEAPLFPKLTMVPTPVHGTRDALPAPVGHMFYDKRVADVADALPKHSGLLASQGSFMRHLFAAKLWRR